MKYIYRLVLIFSFFLLRVCTVPAQVVIVPAGGDGEVVSFTLGQPVAGSAVASAGSAEVGVQQTYTVLVLGLEETPMLAGTTVQVYPNPTSSLVRIDVDADQAGRVEYCLFSPAGQLIESGSFEQHEPKMIDMSGYPEGVYTLKLMKDGVIGANCQIIKK